LTERQSDIAAWSNKTHAKQRGIAGNPTS